MRFPTAALIAACALATISLAGGCANRGMVAPTDGSGAGGMVLPGAGGQAGGGTGGAAGRAGGGGGGNGGAAGGRGGAAGNGGHGGAGGAAGAGGAGGLGNRDAGCGMTDAHADHSTHCTATFSFESGVQGAMLGDQQAFTKLAVSSANTVCGGGALALTAAFSGTTGLTTKGEVNLPLGADGGSVSLAGKTLTIHAAATGTCGTDLKMTVVLVTSAGELFPLRNIPISSDWTTSTATLSADAGSGIGSVVMVQIDVSSFTGYTGTVYLDEIDIR